MNTALDIAGALLAAFLAFGWTRICFAAWTARTTHTTEEET